MTKPKNTTAAPTYVIAGGLPEDVAANIRIVDAGTGETIPGVLEADVEAGKVTRYDVEGGNLVREGDAFKTVEEKRAIRIEWIKPPLVAEAEADAKGAA